MGQAEGSLLGPKKHQDLLTYPPQLQLPLETPAEEEGKQDMRSALGLTQARASPFLA